MLFQVWSLLFACQVWMCKVWGHEMFVRFGLDLKDLHDRSDESDEITAMPEAQVHLAAGDSAVDHAMFSASTETAAKIFHRGGAMIS